MALTNLKDPMRNLLPFTLLLSMLGLFACETSEVAPAEAGDVGTNQVLEGTFASIEQGDYFHINVVDQEGVEQSFFVLRGDSSFDPFFDTPDAYAGKNVRLEWKTSVEHIPEAGGDMEIDQALKISLIE